MLRAQGQRNLLGAVFLVYFVTCHLKEVAAVSINEKDLADLLTMEWSDADVQILKQMMDQHLSHFRNELFKSISVGPTHQQHIKRQTKRSGVNTFSDHSLLILTLLN